MSVKAYQDKVRALGCVVCQLDTVLVDPVGLYFEGIPVSIHHVESVRDELSEYAVVPLCYDHHQGPNGVHGLGRRGFVARYKLTDVDLLALVAKGLNDE